MAGWLDKVHASMDSVVDNIHPIDLVLGIQVGIESLLNVVDDWSPRFVVVDKVSEAGRVDNGQVGGGHHSPQYPH